MLLKYLSVLLSNKIYKSFLLGIVYGFFLNFSSIAMDVDSTEDYGYPGPPPKCLKISSQEFPPIYTIGTKSEFFFQAAIEANERSTSDRFYFLPAMFSESSVVENTSMDHEYSDSAPISGVNPPPVTEEPTSQTQIPLPNMPMNSSISPQEENIQRIKTLIRLGLSHAEISTVVESPLSTIQIHARGERSRPIELFTAANFKEICQLKQTGLSFEAISKRTGFSVARIKYYLMPLQESDNIGNINNMSTVAISSLRNKILDRVRQIPLEEKLSWFN